MATIKRSLSKKVNQLGRAEIMLRVSVSHSVSHRIKSGLFISADRFKDEKFANPRDPEGRKEVREVQDKLEQMEKFLIRLCEDNPIEKVTKGFIISQLELFLNPPKEEEPKPVKEVSFFDIFEDYIAKKKISEWRIKHLRVLKRALMRYELYVRTTEDKKYKIRLDDFNVDDVNDFEKFLRSEHLLYSYIRSSRRYMMQSRPTLIPNGRNQSRSQRATIQSSDCSV